MRPTRIFYTLANCLAAFPGGTSVMRLIFL